MNEQVRQFDRPRAQPQSTQAADGLPRRKWSAAEIQRMIEAGIIEHGERFELIGGELVAMASKGVRHERVKLELLNYWFRRLPEHVRLAPESVLRLGDFDEPEPELFAYPAAMRPEDVRGSDVLLTVEVSKSSLPHDLGLKARLYAAFGVRDYWVLDANNLRLHVHRSPDTAAGTFASTTTFEARDTVTPLLVPELAVRLADLELG